MSSVDSFPNKEQSQFLSGDFLGMAESTDTLSDRNAALVGKRFLGGLKFEYLTGAALFVVAIAGLGLSSYLGWAAWTSSKVAGCSAGQLFDCSHVMHSKWASFMGVPVGVFAAGLYLTTLGFLTAFYCVNNTKMKSISQGVLIVCSISAAIAALWFIGLQIFVLEHLCSYCLAAHTCGLLLAGIVLWKLNIGLFGTTMLSSISLAGVTVLATGQIMAKEPETFVIETFTPIEETANFEGAIEDEPEFFAAPGFEDETDVADQEIIESDKIQTVDPQAMNNKDAVNQSFVAIAQLFSGQTMLLTAPTSTSVNAAAEPKQEEKKKERRIVSVNGGRLKLDAAHWALAGSPDAKLIFVEMFDYTCPHCRENHRSIKGAINRLGADKVAVLTMVTPLDAKCNNTVGVTNGQHAEACELAKISLALWRADKEKFAEFHDWMFEGNIPSAAKALAKAESMVGEKAMTKQLKGTLVGKYIAKHVEFYKRLGAGTVPKLLFPGTTVTGKVGSVDSLVQIINTQTK